MWLPSSVLLKTPVHQALAGRAELLWFATRIPRTFSVLRYWHLMFLSVAAAAVALAIPQREDSSGAVYRALLAVVAPLVLIQVQFGEVSSFFRYDSWLVVLGLTGLAGAIAVFLGGRRGRGVPRLGGVRLTAVAAVTVALFGLLGVRLARATAWAPLASRTIYEQQYQMARFVHDRARGRRVALSDVGAVTFYGESEVVDLAGLAALPVARATMARRADTRWLAAYCAERGVGVAILYEDWLRRRGGVPPSWRALTRWAIRDNFAAAGDTVTVYCTKSADEDSLRAAVLAFETTLPARVARIRVPGGRLSTRRVDHTLGPHAAGGTGTLVGGRRSWPRTISRAEWPRVVPRSRA
jgi:hypothetical protein